MPSSEGAAANSALSSARDDAASDADEAENQQDTADDVSTGEGDDPGSASVRADVGDEVAQVEAVASITTSAHRPMSFNERHLVMMLAVRKSFECLA